MWRHREVLRCTEESEGELVVVVRVCLEEYTGDELCEEAGDDRTLERVRRMSGASRPGK